MTTAVCLLAVAGWFAIVIWAAWQGRWLSGSIAGVAFVALLLTGARLLTGPQPRAYGPVLGVTLFLGAALFLVGLVNNGVGWAVRRRDG